ncbi:MAG: rhomboid family intramembrane serine protease [Acidimicrobiales bacterium]
METAIQTCYRHPDRRAGVICQRCDRPICPDCMRQASVGFHCPECTKSGAQKIVRPRDLVTRPVVTIALMAISIAVYVYGMGGGLDTSNRMIIDGAIAGPPVADGEWYRLITSGFLHAGLIHIGFNMFILYRLGQLVEPVLGRLRFGIAYFVSLLSGSLGVILLQPDRFAVGASGAVFGLMGVTVAVMRSRGIDPFSTGLGGMIVLNLIITFTIPGISIGGHVGGLLGGLVVGYLFADFGPRVLKDPTVTILASVMLGVVVAGSAILLA